ncbi:hypothetical protein [Mesotoga sp.]|uniref:hypothetical protein n=1 Tax=Mesotoga sp. TaxID=2053577 RepID=UPI00345EF651
MEMLQISGSEAEQYGQPPGGRNASVEVAGTSHIQSGRRVTVGISFWEAQAQTMATSAETMEIMTYG